MAKRKTQQKPETSVPTVTSSAAPPAPAPKGDGEAPPVRRKSTPRTGAKPVTGATAATEPQLEAILGEIRSVKAMVHQLTSSPTGGANGADAALESSVDSLRRLLTELIEQRLETVVRDLVDVRRLAAALGLRTATALVDRLDQMLDNLGAIRFEAEAMDAVDPLIHAVVEERQQADAPDGVILETVRPGFRTARGLVMAKAAVAVNRRA